MSYCDPNKTVGTEVGVVIAVLDEIKGFDEMADIGIVVTFGKLPGLGGVKCVDRESEFVDVLEGDT